MRGMLTLKPDRRFYFDRAAADRPVRFIEKFCKHYSGRHAGRPFKLAPVQKKIVRDLYGWKSRRTKRRRFTDVYFEGAVGCGKSPLLAALGLYGLVGEREPSAEVYSLASKYQQARVVFDTGKKFVAHCKELDRRLTVVEREIRHPLSGSIWHIVSGEGPGAGCKPSMILGDEAHDWKKATAYKDLRDRMLKRQQPMLIVATNAGETRASFCWQLREKAVAALEGKGDPALYPIIWAADEDAETDDPAAWRAANPLIGITIDEDMIRQNIVQAMKDPIDEANARRLYLGIWPKSGAGGWLDLGAWDACTGKTPEAAAPPADAPTYIGMDLSKCDDLCAVAKVWPTPTKFHFAAHFWMPRATAERYEAKDGIPYTAWAKAGYITLVEERTISSAVRRDIAAHVIGVGKTRKVHGVFYDHYNADETVAVLEAAGVRCVPVSQGFKSSLGASELERRILERAAAIVPNEVLRFCAENAAVERNSYGEIRVAKPNAKGRYAGTSSLKVDGITALVTALVEARKHVFPAPKNQSTAKAWIV